MADSRVDAVRALIRDVPDFPKPGIMFKDITPMLADARAFAACVDLLAEAIGPRQPDVLIGIESRGFIFAAPVARALGVGFVPVRKPGKLPHRTRRVEYALEYGTDALEMHHDALVAGARVIVVDDVLATGGTAAATGRLVEEAGGLLAGFAFAIELAFLGGRTRLAGRAVDALISY
jgi:adenine phosphoribosyltransferase